MLFMLGYRAYPGKGAQVIRQRQQWQEKYSVAFRKRVNVIHEFADPSVLVGFMLLEMDEHTHLAHLLSLQTVFGDVVEFKLHPVIDVQQALKAGLEEPAGLL
ncbi:MAG: DUF3303 domain-containing protein [Planctomycetota bacterium]|jgi:hypothetical protein